MSRFYDVLLASLGGSIDGFLLQSLLDQGYYVRAVEGGDAVLDALAEGIDLLLINIFATQDVETIARARASSSCAIIAVGPSRAPQLLIAALESGADDYVQRPYRTDELLARVRARLRRSVGSGPAAVQLGPLRLDLRARRATLNGAPVQLSDDERSLVGILASHPGQRYRAAYLIDQLWGAQGDAVGLDAVIRRLRALVEPDPGAPRTLCGDVRNGFWVTPEGG